MHVPSDAYQGRKSLILSTIENLPNRATVERYLDERYATGTKVGTLLNEANALRDLALSLKAKPLEEATREDLVKYATIRSKERIWRNRRKDGTETIRRMRIELEMGTLACRHKIVRHFYKWLLGDGERVPPHVAFLKTRRPPPDDIPTDELVTAEDMRALFQAHPDFQDQALLATLLDSGFRASELAALNVGSVEFDKYGARLTLPKGVPGLKTGARRIRCYEATPYLLAWHQAHPNRHDRNAPLFFVRSNIARGKRYNANSLWRFCQRAKARAKLTKNLRPHLFRHTAATERAKLGWPDVQMRARFGWTKGSAMPATYVHMAGQDFEDWEMRQRGLAPPDASEVRALAPRRCGACGTDNAINAMFCKNCRAPLSPEARAELERQARERLEELLEERAQPATSMIETRDRSSRQPVPST